MHEGVVTSVRPVVGDTELFPITVSSHHGSMLSPYLVALVMDDLTSNMQDEVIMMHALSRQYFLSG